MTKFTSLLVVWAAEGFRENEMLQNQMQELSDFHPIFPRHIPLMPQPTSSNIGKATGLPPNFDPKQICSSLSCYGMTPVRSTQTLSGVGTGAVRCDSCSVMSPFDVGTRCNPHDGWTGMSHLDMLAVSTINVKGPSRDKLATGQSVQFPGAEQSWKVFAKIGDEQGRTEPNTISLGSCKRSALAKGDQDIVSLHYVGVIEHVPLEEEKRSKLTLRKKVRKVKQFDLRVTLSTSTYAHSTEWYEPKEGNRIFIQTTTDISVATPQSINGVNLRIECASTSHACPAQGWRGWVGVYCEKISSNELKSVAFQKLHSHRRRNPVSVKEILPHWTPISPMSFPRAPASQVRMKVRNHRWKDEPRWIEPHQPSPRVYKSEKDKMRSQESVDENEEDEGVKNWMKNAMGEDLQKRRRHQANQNLFSDRR